MLGAAIALTFDVGLFYAIDIDFFTLFSLSEHIVFAIQAFPIALLVLIPFSAAMVIAGRKIASPPYGPNQISRRQQTAVYVVLGLLFLPLISYAGYGLFHSPEVTIVAIELVLLLVIKLTDVLYKRFFMALMAILTTLTISFLLGYWNGRGYFSDDYDSTNVVQFKNGASMSGRIIRSGDRGVLLYDPGSNRLHFVLWDPIGSIEASPPKTTVGR